MSVPSLFGRIMRHLGAPFAVLVIALGAVGLGGCMEDVGLINRTSPYKLDKNLFEGVWIYQQTTAEVPFSTAVSFVGEQPFLGGTSKVVFDIQEKWLIAYPVVETIEGTEKEWKYHAIRKYWDPENRDSFIEMYVGPPVARWPIESHFDVKRAYNSFNGAQSNEVVENTTDRPWYERDYIRVQWHRQGIRDFFFSLKGGGESYFVGEELPWDPDEFSADSEGGYFDYVIRTVTWSTGQNRCYIWDLSAYDCAKAEVKVRHSFRRLDPRRDYEPIRYHNDEQQERFGFFATERSAYDLDWGPTYRGSISYANRWNLWDRTYDFIKPLDEAGEELTISCDFDRDCDREAGQRCQKDESWFAPGYCATPQARRVSERGVRPIIFHLSADWPEEYLDAAYASADNWSDVFKDAVAWALLYDEKGLERPRACEVHADCDGASLVASEVFTVNQTGLPCYRDDQCGGAEQCQDGICQQARACDASAPCDLGQRCEGGICLEDGAPVLVATTEQSIARSSSFVLGDGLSHRTIDSFPSALLQSLPAGHGYVRFLNLDPSGDSHGLEVAGVTISGGAYREDRDLDPLNPSTQSSWLAAVPNGQRHPVKIISGGVEIAAGRADVASNAHTLVIYNGTSVYSVSTTYSRTTQGVRAIHASEIDAKLDLGLEGARVATGVTRGEATEYHRIAGNRQRATLSYTGERGDFSCYRQDTTQGVCMGWGPDLTSADKQRVEELKASLPEMFVLCENSFDPLAAFESVSADDFATTYSDARYTRGEYNICGDAERVAHPESLKKVGDVRYSYFYWVTEPQRAGPLGYGPSQADPETGEILVGNSNIYGGALQTYSQYALELIQLVNGELNLDDVATGEHIRQFLAAKAAEEDSELAAIYGKSRMATALDEALDLHAKPYEDTFLHDARLDTSFRQAKARVQQGLLTPQPLDAEIPELTRLIGDGKIFQAQLVNDLPAIAPDYYHNRLARVQGTYIDDLLINDEVRLAARHIDPEGELSSQELRAVLSPTAWSSKYALAQEEARMRLLGENNIYLADFADDALYALAREFKDSDLSPEEIRRMVGSRILQGVVEHEIGHTVGLRHNFSGSTDVYNFFDEYYEVREREPILCQEQSWCDDDAKEVCAFKSCDEDTDCPLGTLCGGQGVCEAPAASGNGMTRTGVCSTPIVGTDQCTSADDGQACGRGNFCYQQLCYQPAEQFAPRPWMTEHEKANRRTEYQYSSIMDYGGRINSDLMGLGKYDYAAIRYGYTQLVDTYEDVSRLEERIRTSTATSGTAASNSFIKDSRRYWPNRGVGFYHPFMYLTNYIGVEENLKRQPTPYHLVKNQYDATVNDQRGYRDLTYVEVPYAYCSDEFRGNMGCYYFDQGIDMGEMAEGAMDQLSNYYVFDAFKRERLFYGSYGNPMGYYARIMDRYLRVLGDVGMYYALYDNLLFRYSFYDNWKRMPMGGRSFELAAVTSFDTLRDLIAAPAPGSYKVDPITGHYKHFSLKEGAPGSELDIPFGIGRYPYTMFGSDLGYHYYEHPLWFGSFWEKLGALVTLTDSTAYFVDTYVGEQIDVGIGTSLGFNTVFADELNNFLSGIITGDLDFYAGREVQGRYVPPSVNTGQIAAVPVAPAVDNFTMKLYAAVYGLAYMPAGFDPQFIDRLAVFLEGEGTQFHDGADAALTEVRFEDPIGGKVYVAYGTNYGAVDAGKVDVGADILQRAQDLADDWAQETDPGRRAQLQAELSELREVIDLLRRLNQIYGTSTLGF